MSSWNYIVNAAEPTAAEHPSESTSRLSTQAVYGDIPMRTSSRSHPAEDKTVSFKSPVVDHSNSKWHSRKPVGLTQNDQDSSAAAPSDPSIRIDAETPRSATFSHRSTASSAIAQAINGPVRHPERFPNQFLEPRFRNGIVRDLATAGIEFQGTLVFLLTAFLGSRINAGTFEVALAFAMGLLSTIFMHGSSQANPTISCMQAILGKLTVRQAGFNIGAQIAASISASGIQKLMTGQVQSAVALASGISPARGLLIETVLSTILFTTVLYASALPAVKQRTAPFMISLIFLGLELVGIPYTGASINIARFIGPRVTSGSWSTDDWVWVLGPAIAGPLSLLIFKSNQLLQSPDAVHGDIGPSLLVEDGEQPSDRLSRVFRRPSPQRTEGGEV